MINYVEDEDSFEKDILSIFDSKLDKDVPGEESFEGNLSQNNQSLIENDNQKKDIDISGILSNSFSKFRMDVSSEYRYVFRRGRCALGSAVRRSL